MDTLSRQKKPRIGWRNLPYRAIGKWDKVKRTLTMKITDALLAEHVVFHNIFDHIERVLPNLKTLAEVKGWAGLMEGLLLAHGKTEEDLVFAPLNHYLEQLGQRDSFEHEHQEIDNSLLRVKAAKRLPEARQLLLQAVTASRTHFDREERIVFPLAEKVMKDKTLTELGRAWMKQRDAESA
jgi:hemerythrin-like domain-containing protein